MTRAWPQRHQLNGRILRKVELGRNMVCVGGVAGWFPSVHWQVCSSVAHAKGQLLFQDAQWALCGHTTDVMLYSTGLILIVRSDRPDQLRCTDLAEGYCEQDIEFLGPQRVPSVRENLENGGTQVRYHLSLGFLWCHKAEGLGPGSLLSTNMGFLSISSQNKAILLPLFLLPCLQTLIGSSLPPMAQSFS